MNLRARSARSRIPHLPKIVFFIQTQDPVASDAGAGNPELCRVIIFAENRHPQLVDRQFEFSCQECPRVIDGFFLEVSAERKISEHLEKGLVPPRMSDVVQIVVLAAGADTFLAACCRGVGTLLASEKHILELIHSRIDEQQRRIFGRDQRGTLNDGVTAICKELKKPPADFITVQVVLIPLGWRPHRNQDEAKT